MGWVKIGLAVRFAQSLKLNEEPSPELAPWQQEEHRRVFWSAYILDKFVSCCRSRPPFILDVDCTTRLPCAEEHFRMEAPGQMPTLAVLKELPDLSSCKTVDHFATLVLMSSTLGRTVRCSLQRTSSKPLPPWDCRSDFAKINSILFSFENLQTAEAHQLPTVIATRFATYEGHDRQKVGPFIWSRGVYHLCGCLLNHPLLLASYRQRHRADMPATFAKETLLRGQQHAAHLTALLDTVQTQRCCARGSFLGYLATVALSIHRLYQHSPDAADRARANALSQTCLDFLEQPPSCWKNYHRMVRPPPPSIPPTSC